MESIKLNNGLTCPTVGIGTFMLAPADAQNSVREALKMGYRLIDTANAYVNERAVGRGLRESGVKREEIFLSTKLWPSEYENPHAVEETLARLGVDYVDLLYIHQPAGNWLAGYRQLEKAYREGKARAIGISNFEGKYIAELETKWEIVPQFIQVEAHPYFAQDELRITLDKYGIRLMSWYPPGTRRPEPDRGAGFPGAGGEVRQGPRPGHPPLAYPDGLRGHPRQQERGPHPGQPGHPGLQPDGRRDGGDRQTQQGKALLHPHGGGAGRVRPLAAHL